MVGTRRGRKRKEGVNTDWRQLHAKDEPEWKPSKNWSAVYVIEAGGAIKVGVSNDPRGRARAIQTGQLNHVWVYGAVWLDRSDAWGIEHKVHRYLRPRCNVSRGEWFHISAEFALGAIVAEVKMARIKGAIKDFPIGSGFQNLDAEIKIA